MTGPSSVQLFLPNYFSRILLGGEGVKHHINIPIAMTDQAFYFEKWRDSTDEYKISKTNKSVLEPNAQTTLSVIY